MQIPRPTSLEEACSIIERLEARIADLEAKLGKNSKNSSKPPSSDQKGNTPVGRSCGGQKKGHKGYFRQAFPSEQVTKTIRVVPSYCDRCGSGNLVSERKPLFHRVLDLLKIQTELTEYRLERCRCLDCGRQMRSDLPDGVTLSKIGPRLTTWIGAASCQWNLSTRNIRSMVEALTGEAFSTATIWNKEQEISRALAGAYEGISTSFRLEGWVGADETGWRSCGQRRVLWLGSGSESVLVKILKGRSTACAQELLGVKSRQPTVTDRCSSYNYLGGPHQYCLAHWKRDIEGMGSFSEIAQSLSADLERDLKQVFSLWRCYQGGQLARDQFLRRTGYYRRELQKTLEWGCYAADKERVWNFCERSLKDFPKFWTYLRVRGMEPTNNRTERDLRPLVVRRKICYGTGSDAGERYLERAYSVMQTLRRRGADFFSYLEMAVMTYRSGSSSPPLPVA